MKVIKVLKNTHFWPHFEINLCIKIWFHIDLWKVHSLFSICASNVSIVLRTNILPGMQ